MATKDDKNRRVRSRSRSPTTRLPSQRPRSTRRHDEASVKRTLPYDARALTKHDLHEYRPMFALYLDIQKQIDIENLEADEVKGRWKSFIKKWNGRDLAEGWYDPSTLRKAQDEASNRPLPKPSTKDKTLEQEDDDSDFGPALPETRSSLVYADRQDRQGPTIPNIDDIKSRSEDARLEADQERERRLKDLENARKSDRIEHKERLEEIAPRADPGSRERQLEKKRDVADSNRAFATAKDGGDAEIPESDVMGGDDLNELKKKRKEQERRKTDREIKRDEILRAKAVEREERSKRVREKEEKTMNMLKELARSRFGDGNVQPATLKDN